MKKPNTIEAHGITVKFDDFGLISAIEIQAPPEWLSMTPAQRELFSARLRAEVQQIFDDAQGVLKN